MLLAISSIRDSYVSRTMNWKFDFSPVTSDMIAVVVDLFFVRVKRGVVGSENWKLCAARD